MSYGLAHQMTLPHGRPFLSILHELMRYSVSGVGSFALDLGLLYLLVKNTLMPYPLAVALAFLIAILIHYTVCRVWVFRRSRRGVASGYVYFMLILLSSLGLTVGIVTGLVELLALNLYVARTIASLVAGLWSFYANSHFNFRVLHGPR